MTEVSRSARQPESHAGAKSAPGAPWARLLGLSLLWLGLVATTACERAAEQQLAPARNGAAPGYEVRAPAPGVGAQTDDGYDPLAFARAAGSELRNVWATVPVQCYARTPDGANACWVCHSSVISPNVLADWPLQTEYGFVGEARFNPWTNLFEDRTEQIAAISDQEIQDYLQQDNYTPLKLALAERKDYPGFRPDLDLWRGFDEHGFARDGSGWRAVRYKPMPGGFWPTNGSAGDVMVRLPKPFRTTGDGQPSVAVYKLNLAILEATMASDPFRFDEDLERAVEPLDEALAGVDLNGDGRVGGVIEKIVGLPATYVGGASAVAVQRRLYPEGTEFLHTVRYVDVDAQGLLARRMKELRYSRKIRELSRERVTRAYRGISEVGEVVVAYAPPEKPPEFEGTALTGLSNAFGWRLQSFIEDKQGRLRLQTYEEQQSCMGCHTTMGTSVDQTFAFPRKLPGSEGWRPQDLGGMHDAPQVRHGRPEILTYFARVHGGDDFRGNSELLARFFPNGKLDEAKVLRAADGGDRDLAWLLTPSRERALEMAKAYLCVVRAQDFVFGRDANSGPVQGAIRQVENLSTGLEEAGTVHRDGRPFLDWSRK